MIIHDGNNVPRLEFSQDPNEAKKYTYQMRPAVWHQDTVYYDKRSVVIPSVFNGYYYISISGGKSQAVEPTWPCRKGETVQDGCITWKAVPYDLFLRPGENIRAANWASDTDGVTISNITTTHDKTSAFISTIPATVTEIKITIHFDFNDNESADRSFIIPVAEL